MIFSEEYDTNMVFEINIPKRSRKALPSLWRLRYERWFVFPPTIFRRVKQKSKWGWCTEYFKCEKDLALRVAEIKSEKHRSISVARYDIAPVRKGR